MDQLATENLELDSDSNAEGIYSSKNLNLQTESEQVEQELDIDGEQEEYIFEEDDDGEEEEQFEDAIDQIVVQNVLDCINESSESYDESRQLNEEADLVPISSEISIASHNESSVNRQVQILLERQRNELAMELRKLKMSKRPQETRNHLEQVFSGSAATTSRQNETEQTHLSLSSHQTPPSFRSEIVQNEILQLGNRRMVSSIQSSFRDSIERTLRQRLETASSTVQSPARVINSLNEQIVPRPNDSPIIRPTLPFLLSRSENPVQNQTREQIIYEISDLVHRELVSSTLQSDFRPRLEANIRNRIRELGIDSNRTRRNIQEFLQSTRVSNAINNIQRNDFSHLGINTVNSNLNTDPAENLDSASSSDQQTTRQRATIVYQNNAREMRELRSDLNDMKNLLKLSLEMQLDMQRCFKQEISALVAGTFHDTASFKLVNSTQPNHQGKCIICTEADCDTVLYKCGHMVSCYVCSVNLRNKGHTCPVCRAPIEDIVRTFKSSLN